MYPAHLNKKRTEDSGMYDNYQRNIDYFRISITDRCNLRCRYCMPEGIPLISMDQILRYEEILAICTEAVSLGIRKYKITGGEPLVRIGCDDLIREMKKIPGVEQVTITTNGVLLSEYIDALVHAGIDGINVSLDTLDPIRYQFITGFNKLDQVIASVREALDQGLKVKVNCVLQRGINEEEWPEILELARKDSLDVRFIELMPIGEGKKQEGISNVDLLSLISERYPGIKRDYRIHGNGPAVYYRIPGFIGSLGLISAIHGKFCHSCNRIRMTATGDIKSCLCYDKGINIRDAVRNNDREQIRDILKEAILEKPMMHRFEDKNEITEHKKMVQIGG